MILKGKKKYWTIKECIAHAKKYKSCSNWKFNNQSSYNAAHSNGWYYDCKAFLTNPKKKLNGYWNIKENCIKDALKYKTRSSWQVGNGSSVLAARRNGWMEECCKHMISPSSLKFRYLYTYTYPDKSIYVGLSYDPLERKSQHFNPNSNSHSSKILRKLKRKFGKDQIFEIIKTPYNPSDAAEAEIALISEYKKLGFNLINKNKGGGLGGSQPKRSYSYCEKEVEKYNTIKDLIKHDNGLYQFMNKNNWQHLHEKLLRGSSDEHGPRKIGTFIFSDLDLHNIAKKYPTIKEFREKDESAYVLTGRRKIRDKVCSHMKRLTRVWHRKSVIKVASTCKHKSDFEKTYSGAFKHAVRNNFLDKLQYNRSKS